MDATQSTDLFSAVLEASRQGIGILNPLTNSHGEVVDFTWQQLNTSLIKLFAGAQVGSRLSDSLHKSEINIPIDSFKNIHEGYNTRESHILITEKGATLHNLTISKVSAGLLIIAEKIAAETSGPADDNSELLDAVLNAPDVGIVVFKSIRDADNKIVDFEYQLHNKKNLNSSDPRDFTGQRLFEIRPGARKFLDNLKRVVDEGIPEMYEVRIDDDLEPRWIRNRNTKFRDGFINVWEDITAQKNAQLTLEEERNRINLAEALGHVGSFEWNLVTNKIYWSDELYRIHGLEPQSERITMSRILQLIHPEDVTLFKHKIKRGTRHEGIIRFTHRLLLPSGLIRYITRTFESYADEKGNIVRMNGNVQDITESRLNEMMLTDVNKQLVEQINEAEKREAHLRNFERIVNTSHDAIISTDLDGRIIQWSKSAELFYGYTAAEMVGSPLELIVESECQQQLESLLERVRQGESFAEIESRRKAKDNRVLDVLLNLFPLRDETGAVVATCGITKDVTERKRAEKQLLEGRNRFEAAINLSPTILSIFRCVRNAHGQISDFYIEWASKSGIEVAGRDVAGLSLLSEFPHMKKVGLFERFVDVVETGVPADVEKFYDEDGFNIWVHWKAVKLEDGLFISAEDVTHRRRNEDEFKSQAHFINSIMDTVWDVVSVLEHPSFNIQYINPAAERMLDLDIDSLRHKTAEERFSMIYHPDDIDALKVYFARFDNLEDHEQNEIICRVRSKKNQWKWLLVRGRIFQRDPDGRVTHSVNIAQDITDKKEAELQLKQTNDLLEAVFDSTSNSIGVYRPVYGEAGNIIDYDVLMVNPAVTELIGGKNPVGSKYLESFSPAGNNMIAIFNLVMQTGETLDIEHEYEWPSGTRTFRIVSKRVDDMLIVTGEDITQRKKAERELKESKDLLQSVFDGVQSSITVYRILYDETGAPADFEILMFNDFAYRTSRTDSTILGRKMTEVFRSAESNGVLQKFLDVAASGGPLMFETMYEGDSMSHWLHFNVNRLDDLLVVITEDTTSRRAVEEEQWRHAQILQQTEAVAGIGTWEYSIKEQTLRWSDGMYRLYNIPSDTVATPEAYRDAVISEDLHIAERIISHFRTDHEGFEEIIRIDADEIKTLKVSGRRLGDNRIIGVELDISTIAASEKTLKDQAHFINQIAITMPDIVTVVNLHTRQIEYINKNAFDTRIAGEELLGKSQDQLFSLIHPDDVHELDDYFKEFYLLTDHDTVTVEFRARNGRNGWYWYRARGRVFKRDDRGAVTHCVCVIQNTTEQKTADKALQENKDLLQSVFKSTTNTIAVLKPIASESQIEDFEVVMANKELPFFPGSPIGARVGKLYASQSDDESVSLLIEKLKHVLETGQAAEYDQVLSQGKKHWLHSVAVKLEGEIVVTQQDITESVESRMSLEQLNQSLKQKNEELKNRNLELANFAFIASHDLREPLRKILVFSNYLVEKESENLSDQGRDYCMKIIRAINRMNALIDDVLEYSRSTSAPKTRHTEVRLNDVLKTVLTDISEYVAEHDATVDAENLPVIKGNPLQLSQLLQNLITNSIKFHREGVSPYVMIRSNVILGKDIQSASAHPNQKYIKIDVADNGIGFDQRFEDKIFQMFQRLHDRSDFPGTGMGLAICKRVMENHRGFISAKGFPGTGAVFSCYFPVRR